jgi:hypothetical protein
MPREAARWTNSYAPPPRPGTLVAKVALGVLAVIIACAVAFVAVVANALNHLGEIAPRDHLSPIPIGASACPYVVLMHAAANNFQSVEPFLGVGFDAHGKQLTWKQTRNRLRPALETLERSIEGSSPHFPIPVQRQLAVALANVRVGRVDLAVARNGNDLFDHSWPAVQEGQRAFGYASDLIGKRCSVKLEADAGTMPYPLSQPTAPLRTTPLR